MSAPWLAVEDVAVRFPIRRGLLARVRGHVHALDGVSFTLERGETLGLAGESGCGKTTLGRVLAGLERPTSGVVRLNGDILFAPGRRVPLTKEQRRRIQVVFQDPQTSLNPRLTICDLLTEGLVEHRLLGDETREAAAIRLLGEVGLDASALWKYPFEFSGGQRQRICIARALALRPDLVICDEVVSALDVSVQAQVINLLMDLRERHGLAYLMIGHDLSVLRHVSHRIAVMYLGRLAEIGPADALMSAPRHPYTQALVAAVPVPGETRQRRPLSGEPPSA
ncbi:MAG: ATP-binding cassette domain-containing protein, partial [Kiritimatiellia bacterium]